MTKLVLVSLCAVIACSFAAMTPEQGQKLAAWQATCFKETGVSIEVLMGAIAANSIDDAVKAHVFCLGREVKLLDAAGKYTVDNLKAELNLFDSDSAKVNALVTKCDLGDGLNTIICLFTGFTT